MVQCDMNVKKIIIEFDVGKQTVSDNNFNCMFELLLTKGIQSLK